MISIADGKKGVEKKSRFCLFPKGKKKKKMFPDIQLMLSLLRW